MLHGKESENNQNIRYKFRSNMVDIANDVSQMKLSFEKSKNLTEDEKAVLDAAAYFLESLKKHYERTI